METTIDLLWTSGWDSSFRLLQAALVEKRKVRPHYIIDAARRSTGLEILRMQKIIREARVGHTCSLIEPLVIHGIEDCQPPESVREAFKALRGRARLGYQYLWLAGYSKRVPGIELSIHKDDIAYPFGDAVSRGIADEAVREVFGAFSFPLLQLTKVDMLKAAEVGGFLELLELSWFCHSPLATNEPCGICNPCTYTIDEGMGYRLTATGRRNHASIWWKRPIRRLLRGAERLLIG